jgi:transposase
MKRARPWEVTIEEEAAAWWTRGGRSLIPSRRAEIVDMYYDDGLDVEAIASRVPSPRGPGHICTRTVTRVLEHYHFFGHVERLPRKRWPGIMPSHHRDLLLGIVDEKPWLFLDEIADELRERGLLLFEVADYSENYIYKVLVRNGYSLKTMRQRAAQRDESQRLEYWTVLLEECWHPCQLLFADETARDDRALRRRRGWGQRNSRVQNTSLLRRGAHVSVLALYGFGGFVDFAWKEGGYSSDDFLFAFKTTLLPHLRPFPQEGSILVLDNCKIHWTHVDEMRSMVEAVGAKLLFLAPYWYVPQPELPRPRSQLKNNPAPTKRTPAPSTRPLKWHSMH